MPVSFATTSDGTLFIASGMGAMLKWGGACAAATVGVPAPTPPPFMTGSGEGNILGEYYAYTRFVDKDENVSNLSPISPMGLPIGSAGGSGTTTTITAIVAASAQTITIEEVSQNILASTINLIGTHGLPPRTHQFVRIANVDTFLNGGTINGLWHVIVIDDQTINVPNGFPSQGTGYAGNGNVAVLRNTVTGASNANPIVITVSSHELSSGQIVKIQDVNGNTAANGVWAVTVLTANTFSLNGSIGSGSYTNGGSFSTGVETLTYSNLEPPTDPKVVRRQILRNVDGDTSVFFIDIDTEDIWSTSLESTQADEDLQNQIAVALLDDEGGDLAISAYSVPPNHRSVIAHHQGHMFAVGEVEYSQGNVQVTFGSKTVYGIGTEFVDALAARFLHVVGADQGYEIESVSRANQTLTLLEPYRGGTDLFAVYTIKPPPANRRLLHWAEAGLPEAWPPVNAFAIPETGDEITGLMPYDHALFVIERRHMHRFLFTSHPGDGTLFPSIDRGCVNNRCWVRVEGMVYMLDEGGIYVFDGASDTEPLSSIIQDLFRPSDSDYRINWKASKWFHAAHFASQEVIRWFVTMSGQKFPRHAICLNYRSKRWWIEDYPLALGASCPWPARNRNPGLLVGSEAKKVFSLWEHNRTLDGPDPAAGTVRGTVTSSTLTSLSDSSATFASSGLVLSPLTIVSGKGKGQTRTIASVSGTTLNITQPWAILPDTTSTYQIGGVHFTFQTGWFRFIPEERDNMRRIELLFQATEEDCETDLHIFPDYSDTPMVVGTTYTSTDNNGVALTKDSPHMVIDMTKSTGIVQIKLPGHKELYADGGRFISIELDGLSNADPVVFYGMTIDGVK